MSCATCEMAAAESTLRNRTSRGSGKDTPQSLDISSTITLQQDTARIAQLQGECLEQHAQQSQAMRSQLQSIMAEQASLRALLEQQHEQLLQRLPSHNGSVTPGDTWHWHPHHKALQAPLPPTLPPTLPEGHLVKDEPVKTQSKLMRAASVQIGSKKHVILDIGRLPTSWSITEDALEEMYHNHPYWYQYLRSVVRGGKFDAVFISVIFLNFITMFIQLQWRGYHAAFVMGYRDDDNDWQAASGFFETLDVVYTTIFLVEAILRIIFLGSNFFCHPANLFDMGIVLLTCLQAYLLTPLGLMADASSISIARLLRLLRVLRFLKVVRYTEAATELRILARALGGCIGSLVWSVLLLTALVVSASIMLFQFTVTYVENENNPWEMRRFAYVNFGTISLSIMALWESTFTGSWHRYSRDMIVNMGAYYALFWVPYIICVNFAVMRLISALFLKNTMAVAAVDAEKMSMAKMKRKQDFANKIRQIFQAADTSGDGKISADEFEEMLSNPKVGDCFEQLELEVSEVATLFELLAQDGGEADYHEFLEGALKLKQSAQTVDVIQIIHNNRKLAIGLHTVHQGLCDLARHLGAPLDHLTDGLSEALNQADSKSMIRSSKRSN